MEISPDNKKIINVLNVLINGVPEEIFSQFPVIALEQKSLELAGINYIEAREVINKLMMVKYLEQISNKDFNNLTDILKQAQEKHIEEEIKSGEITPEEFLQREKNKLKDAGIDVEELVIRIEKDPEEDLKLDEILSLNSEIRTNNIQEHIAKSTRIGNYITDKNLFDLRKTLENGVDFDDINHHQPTTLRFDIEESILHIKGYQPVKIKKRESKPTTREHSVLKFIFADKDISKKFYHWEFADNDVYENNLTTEDYYQICRDINTKTKDILKEKFLHCNSEFAQIKSKFL